MSRQPSQSFTDRTLVVSGASRGIGLAIAVGVGQIAFMKLAGRAIVRGFLLSLPVVRLGTATIGQAGLLAVSANAVGACRYGLMLREDGMVFDDGVTARLGENHYLMTTTSGGAGACGRSGWTIRVAIPNSPTLRSSSSSIRTAGVERSA